MEGEENRFSSSSFDSSLASTARFLYFLGATPTGLPRTRCGELWLRVTTTTFRWASRGGWADSDAFGAPDPPHQEHARRSGTSAPARARSDRRSPRASRLRPHLARPQFFVQGLAAYGGPKEGCSPGYRAEGVHAPGRDCRGGRRPEPERPSLGPFLESAQGGSGHFRQARRRRRGLSRPLQQMDAQTPRPYLLHAVLPRPAPGLGR